MILEKPVDSVVRAAALLICRKRHNNVTVGLESFLLVLNQVCNPDSGLRLVIASSTTVEIAVLFGELKRIDRPVLALGFDNINVGKKQKRFTSTGPVITDDEIGFFRACTAQKNIGIGESRSLQASGRRFGDRRRRIRLV